MADKKISALTAASTPLAGTEVLPIVQSGATVKVAVSDLTAGRAISATQLTLTTGNLIVASGQGVDFSATPGTGTSELLDDYEEGTWTPEYTSSGGAFTSITYAYQSGYYVKIGRYVFAYGRIGTVSNPTGGSGNLRMTLPFASLNAGLPPGSGEVAWNASSWTILFPTHFAVNGNAALADLIGRLSTGQTQNIALVNMNVGSFMEFSVFYEAAT